MKNITENNNYFITCRDFVAQIWAGPNSSASEIIN
jgi:hypothetical protein